MLKITVKNYQIIEDLTFEVDGITVISGKSNNGKSAVFRAIQACCLGQLGKQFIRHGEKECEVKLLFDKEFGWGRNKKEPYFLMEGKDKPYTKTGGTPPDEFSQELNIKVIKPNEKVSVVPNFASQFDSLFVVGSGPTEAAAVLSFLFSGEKFPDLLKKISKEIKDDKSDITFKEGAIEQMESLVRERKGKRDQLQTYQPFFEYRKHIAMWKQAFQILDREISDLQKLEEAVKEKTPEVESLRTQAAVLSTVEEEAVDFLETLEKDLHDLLVRTKAVGDGRTQAQIYRVNLDALSTVDDSVVAYLEGLEKDTRDIQELQEDFKIALKQAGVIKTEEQLYASVDEAVLKYVVDLEEDLNDLNFLLADIGFKHQQAVALKKDYDFYTGKISEELSKITMCPTCSSLLTEETKSVLLNSLEG